MKQINWVSLFEEYRGMWVALEEHDKKVVAFGDTAQVVYDAAIEQGVKVPILFKVPVTSVPFVG